MVSFAKGKLRNYTYIFQLCGNTDAKILARSLHHDTGARMHRKGEAGQGRQRSKSLGADPKAGRVSYYALAAILFFPFGVLDLSWTPRSVSSG